MDFSLPSRRRFTVTAAAALAAPWVRAQSKVGIQHDAFSYEFQGLDARLTGVEGAKVIKKILA
jgi:hypothetical protein